MNPDPILSAAISRLMNEVYNRISEIKDQINIICKSYNDLEKDISTLDKYCRQYYEQGNKRHQESSES